ncbi:hypothetical protein Tco_0089545 [Tanacetum coccineum]
MANMNFYDKHNMMAFLQNLTGSEEFHQIVDFLAGSHIRYALTANPTIYVSLIEQFWQTVTVDIVNDGEQQLTVIVDGQTIAITEASVRRHLQLADADDICSLPNTEIFDQLTLIGYALTTNPTIYVSLIEQFWQTVTVDIVNDGEQQLTVIVDGQTIAITEASVRRHLQLADADDICSLPNTEIFDQLTLIGPKKTSWEQFSSNIATAIICLATTTTFKFSKLIFDGVHIPLFDTMLIHDQPGQGDRPTLTVESQHTPIDSPSTPQPTTSQPMSSQEQPSQVPITEPITDSFTT